MSKICSVLLSILLIAACTSKKEVQQSDYAVTVVKANGIPVSTDSIKEPLFITVDESKLIKIPAKTPLIVATNVNISPVGTPKITAAGTPGICTPGKDTFLLPKIVLAKDSIIIAGTPEILIAKDAYIKDQNPHSFSTFGKLQGLKHGTINCLLEDQFGNLWFGTGGGGVTRYDGKSFAHFTEKEGLCSNVVTCVLEDKNGTIWFGTDGGGITKYDGKNFIKYTDKNGLNNNKVLSILEDQKGNIWIGTHGGGVCKYDGKYFTHFTTKEGLANNFVKCLIEDEKGNIWMGTSGAGLCIYDGKNFTHYNEKSGLNNAIILSLFEDKSGSIWIGTDGGGVSKYNGKNFMHYTKSEGLVHNVIWSISEDQVGNLWFGSWGGGVSKYDGKNFTNFTEKEGLSNNVILNMLEDKTGNFWLGTNGGGVAKYNGKIFTHFTGNEGLSNSYGRSIIEDKSGNLWIATYGGGVSKYDGKNFNHYTEKEGLCDNDVRCMLQDQAGNLWFGTFGGGVSKFDGLTFTHLNESNGLINNYILSMFEDRAGAIWFGTNGSGVVKYSENTLTYFTTESGLSDNVILSIAEDQSGNLWFGSNGKGVTKFDPSADKKSGKRFIHYTDESGLSNNAVRSILEDRDGNMWFGTNGGGVCRYDGEKFTHYTENEGLSHNNILSMLQDKAGNFWFGTRFGLSKLSPDKLKEIDEKIKSNSLKETDVFFKNYSYEDGFLGIGVNGGNTIYQDKNGIIWIGANDRLTAFHPEGENKTIAAPKIQLTSIDLFNESILWSLLEKKKDSVLTLGNGVSVGDFEFDEIIKWYGLPKNLSLAYNNNYLTFQFSGISMHQPKQIKYQYKLEGIDKNWSAISTRTEAPYGNLPNGTFTFKVKAMNSDGVWSETLDYTFTIRPPWWKTWWFRLTYSAAFIISLFVIFRWRTASLRKRQKQLEQTVEERTEELVQKNQLVEKQKEIVEEKNKKILDSITYAKRIQEAILPGIQKWKERIPQSSILYLPKDIVAGDFYWMEKNDHFIYVAAGDCTGHGIPGALVSVICSNALTLAVVEEKLTETNEILDRVREIIVEKLSGNEAETVRDGMDICLIRISKNRKDKIQYSGANRPLWLARNKELIEYKPDKQAISFTETPKPFTALEITVQELDTLYLFTDGYADQFGGYNLSEGRQAGKKFMIKRLKELLITIANEPLDLQKENLKKTFTSWKGDLDQVDDVCVIVLRV